MISQTVYFRQLRAVLQLRMAQLFFYPALVLPASPRRLLLQRPQRLRRLQPGRAQLPYRFHRKVARVHPSPVGLQFE